MSIVVVGAYTRDLYMFGPRLPGPGETVDCGEYVESHGGKGANQAVAAARLGARVALITGLGMDRIGDEAFALLAGEGLDLTYTRRDGAAPTGVGFIILDPQGIQLITTYAGASARLNIDDIKQAGPVLSGASAVLLQGEIPGEVSLAAARLAGENSRVILDPGPVEPFVGLDRFENIDILTPNEQEAALLLGAPQPSAADLRALTGVPVVIVKRGADGAEVCAGDETVRIPAPPARAVDTTGAGDAFNGALAAGLVRGLDLMSAVQHACRCASFSVGRRFCIPSLPTQAEVPWPQPSGEHL